MGEGPSGPRRIEGDYGMPDRPINLYGGRHDQDGRGRTVMRRAGPTPAADQRPSPGRDLHGGGL